jgi:predicted DNA-binding protein (UPF0251 family)
MLTSDQFAALATLAGLRSAKTAEAARLVMVFGLPVGAAADRAGISQSAASHTIARVRRVHKQAFFELG